MPLICQFAHACFTQVSIVIVVLPRVKDLHVYDVFCIVAIRSSIALLIGGFRSEDRVWVHVLRPHFLLPYGNIISSMGEPSLFGSLITNVIVKLVAFRLHVKVSSRC